MHTSSGEAWSISRSRLALASGCFQGRKPLPRLQRVSNDIQLLSAGKCRRPLHVDARRSPRGVGQAAVIWPLHPTTFVGLLLITR